MILQERKRIKMETLKQRKLNYEKIKTAEDCTEKKEIIHSKKTRNSPYGKAPFSLMMCTYRLCNE